MGNLKNILWKYHHIPHPAEPKARLQRLPFRRAAELAAQRAARPEFRAAAGAAQPAGAAPWRNPWDFTGKWGKTTGKPWENGDLMGVEWWI